jgi:predicted O-methyltransferase YrrM
LTDHSPRLTLIRSARRRLDSIGPSKLRAPGDYETLSVPTADCDVLRDLLISEHPQAVIEIGLGYGSSALAIAEALLLTRATNPRHIVIDPNQDHFHRSGWQVLVEAGWTDSCVLVEERSQTALPRLLADGLVVDAAFVDGSHLFHNVFVDLFYLNELLRPGGLVILDDADLASVGESAKHFESNLGWHRVSIKSPTRLAAWRTPNT